MEYKRFFDKNEMKVCHKDHLKCLITGKSDYVFLNFYNDTHRRKCLQI